MSPTTATTLCAGELPRGVGRIVDLKPLGVVEVLARTLLRVKREQGFACTLDLRRLGIELADIEAHGRAAIDRAVAIEKGNTPAIARKRPAIVSPERAKVGDFLALRAAR